MKQPKALPMIAAAAAIASPAMVAAEPPGLHAPAHHAEPPVPGGYESPMPSLPPPASKAPGEKPEPLLFGTTTIKRRGFKAHVRADGSIHFDGDWLGGGAYLDPVRGTGASFDFDITDMLLGGLGQDPYLSEKLALMDASRQRRAEIRAAHSGATMERALADLPTYLDAVWNHPEWSARTRRRILFLLWDEAAERGSDLVREGGSRARRLIKGFIARTIPPGSPNAFTAAELTAFNRERTSGRPFEPYRTAKRAPTVIASAPRLARLMRAF